ncbi:hypothetical protein MAH1_21140 [Sessilibacter sp. MAH1]
MSVLLDTEKIKSCAKQVGILYKAQLDKKMSDIRAEVDAGGSETRAGSRAWDGIAISESNARLLAQALGVPHFEALKHDEPHPWIVLRNNTSRHKKIITMEIESTNRNRLFELDMVEPNDGHTVKISDRWRLNLTFKSGYHALVVIRNETKHMVITPNEAFNLPSQWQNSQLSLPSEETYLRFPEKEGGGFREIIVIACDQNVFPKISLYDDNIFSSDKRNSLATKLLSPALQEKYWVDSYAFYIQDSAKTSQE